MSNEFDIAVVGMAGRFPGARNIDEFWMNLVQGVESITRFSDKELLDAGVPASYLKDPRYVKAAPILDGPECFDAAFFGFSPAEAKAMDPQHRILLELAHEALENSGYDPERYSGRVSVFTGSAMNTYFTNVGLNNRLAEDYIPTLIGNDKDFLSTRISYKLNLKGPSITVQTACSTSLVAIHLARQSLLSGEADMALAGAISVRVPHRSGYFFDAGGVVSPDGRIRTFDADANGTVFGSGGGVLILKRFDDALTGGDEIYAIIKGSAVNNDGSGKAGYTAPSVDCQAEAVVEALANAGIDADSVNFIEAHGSGTPVGDPIEIKALTKAFRASTQRSGYCAIGSVKTNVGHLDAAAGIAGVIKSVLALKKRKLPASLNFSAPNPEINFADTPFFVNTCLREWTSGEPQRAGVMSTGMGGTNAFVVLEEAPGPAKSNVGRQANLLVLSAKTESALHQATYNLQAFLSTHESVSMSDVAYTLQLGRKTFPYRRALVCNDRQDALSALAQEGSKRILSGRAESARRPLILLLPGIGDHYVGMAHDLYESWPAFKEEVDRCATILEKYLRIDIRTILYPDSRSWKRSGQSKGIDLKQMLGGRTSIPTDPDTATLNKTIYAQPALFTIEYAMARVWQSLGITPDAIVGHSMGEYVAACLAGVLSLEDALRLIATRAKLVNALPEGAMLAVMLPESELLPLLSAELSVSLINGPALCVVAGPPSAIADLEKTLTARSIISRHVQNAHAFHSRMLDPIVPAFEAEVRKVRLNEPQIPYISNVSGTWITARQATDPAYWAMHANHTARFSDALHKLWQFEHSILLEAGPGRTLGVLATQHPSRSRSSDPLMVASIRHSYENQSDSEFLLQALGKLWGSGVTIEWQNVHAGTAQRRIALPTYPFERQKFWSDSVAGSAPGVLDRAATPSQTGLDTWFYAPSWERTTWGSKSTRDEEAQDCYWLVIADQYGGGMRVRSMLQTMGRLTCFVTFGRCFASRSDGSFELNPAAVADYVKLFGALKAKNPKTINIVHLGSLTRDNNEVTLERCLANQKVGFYSLLHIAQAIGELDIATPVKIGIVSNRIHEVTGDESLEPTMATVLGPCGVIPKEFPNITCFNVDLPDNQPIEDRPDELIAAMLSEFAAPAQSQVIAYRGKHRWMRHYVPVQLPKREGEISARLRRRGVYLITGGTGGIGLAISKHLASKCQPRLMLTKKTPFPAKSRWREILAANEASQSERDTIQALLEIEQLGAEVDVVVAESADKEQMRRALDETRRKFGAINGVVHAAGIVNAGLIQTKTTNVAESVLGPKVYGTMILHELLKDANLDFLVLFSSITSVITPYAESDYSGANAFLDAYASFANARTKFHTLAINWPGWKEVGQLVNLQTQHGVEGWKEAALEKAIRTADGLEAFERALQSELAQVVVSPENLEKLLEDSRQPFNHEQYLSLIKGDATVAVSREPQKGAGAQPAADVPATMASIWETVLGFAHIDPQDNFIQLGGHSLLAMQIVNRIRSAYPVSFTIREFFESPTIAAQSAIITAKLGGETEISGSDPLPAAFSPMGQRFFSAGQRQSALFLGLPDRQLFAIHHPPTEKDLGILTIICPPLFNEYMRTHLALRELAVSLAEKGQHVIRFDYRGTGDSSNELSDVTVADWLEDIALVVHEGRRLSACRHVRMLGVRVGALLACKSASAGVGIERLVLWDPISDGAGFLQAMRHTQSIINVRDLNLSRIEREQASKDFAGYGLSDLMVKEFRLLDSSVYTCIPPDKIHVVSTSTEAGIPQNIVSRQITRFACNWETDLDNLLMPKPVLEYLSACLTQP